MSLLPAVRAVIRPATPDDAFGCANVHHTSWVETYSGLLPANHWESDTVERRTATWQGWLAGDATAIVAEYASQIIGIAFASAGPTTLVVEVGGTVGNRSVVIAEDEIDYIVIPGTQEVELDIEIPNRLNNRRFTSLHIELYNRGVAPLHGWYLTNNPGSFLTMPILVRRR
jgi:hypothetical protein